MGVVLFFVLSGFLITTLLFGEKKNNYDINLKKFYLRRILRIWPLYFLVIGLSILALNHYEPIQIPVLSERALDSLDLTSIILIIFILPNLLIPPVHPIPYAGQLWSIGIEEQFYLLQPFLIKFVKDYRVQITVLLLIVFSKELANLTLDSIDSRYFHRAVSQLVFFGCIAIGCNSAILYIKQPDIIKSIAYNRYLQLFSYMSFIVFLYLIYNEKKETAVDFRLHALIFAILILNVATNPLSIIKIKNRALAYLGKISYGIYMYHPICIGFSIAFTRYILGPPSESMKINVLVYSLSVTLTLLLSAISFRYFEGYFMRFKKRYAVSET